MSAILCFYLVIRAKNECESRRKIAPKDTGSKKDFSSDEDTLIEERNEAGDEGGLNAQQRPSQEHLFPHYPFQSHQTITEAEGKQSERIALEEEMFDEVPEEMFDEVPVYDKDVHSHGDDPPKEKSPVVSDAEGRETIAENFDEVSLYDIELDVHSPEPPKEVSPVVSEAEGKLEEEKFEEESFESYSWGSESPEEEEFEEESLESYSRGTESPEEERFEEESSETCSWSNQSPEEVSHSL